MITIKDVAELAGVSKSTVSNVINKTANVSEETRSRVMLAIEALNFIPSSNAKNLRSACTKEIGVVLSSVDDSIHRDILNGICSVMQRAEYFVNIAFSHGNVYQEQEKIRMLLSKQLDGLVLLTCQDHNSEYFPNIFRQITVPSYFVLRKPVNIPCNFAGFNHEKITYDITYRMLTLGYRHISLVCGKDSYSSENEAISGFIAAHKAHNLYCPGDNICQTLMTKEDAFKVTITRYRHKIPDAVIATSSAISKGILETIFLLSKKVGEDIAVISLGDEGWCLANQTKGILTTNSNAVKLGEQTADSLLQIIRQQDSQMHSILIEDTFDTRLIPAPPQRKASIRLIKSTNTLTLLASPLLGAKTLDIISGYFEANTPNTKILFRTAESSEELRQELEQEKETRKCRHDLYLYSSGLLPYIVSHSLLKDISSYIADRGENTAQIIPHYLTGCQADGRYFGIPFVVSCQILLYRRDLFENHLIRKQYQKKYGAALHLPRTWVEYNRICEFFTLKNNPLSPVEYGTSLGLSGQDWLLPWLLPYIWGCGGEFFRPDGLPALDSPSFQNGLSEFLQTIEYISPACKKMHPYEALDELLNDQCAMIITSSDMASNLQSSLKFDERFGVSLLPGKAMVYSSWNLGVSNYTLNSDMAYRYLDWIMLPRVNSYLAILSGQSPIKAPYHNNELKRLYPWMDMLQYIPSRTHIQTAPYQAGSPVIPPERLEGIIANIIYDVTYYEGRLPDSIGKAQTALKKLMQTYRNDP